MATNDDLSVGTHIDFVLARVSAELPRYETDPAQTIAALLALDVYFGLHHPDDYALISPEIAFGLIPDQAVVTDVELSAALACVALDDSAALAAISVLATARPFAVALRRDLNSLLLSPTVRVRVMTPDEAASLSTVHTVRADGSFIRIPGFEGRSYRDRLTTLAEIPVPVS